MGYGYNRVTRMTWGYAAEFASYEASMITMIRITMIRPYAARFAGDIPQPPPRNAIRAK